MEVETLPGYCLMPGSDSSPSPTRRADAERNRARILRAAREAFTATPDGDVSMAEIARRSGVGSATLYRNFANRPALLEALYVDEIDALCAATAELAGESPGAVFVAWLRRFYVYFTSKRLVADELLRHLDATAPVFGTGYERVVGAGRPLLEAARAAGGVRDGLTLEQILDMVAAIARIPGDDGYREPILAAALDALLADGA